MYKMCDCAKAPADIEELYRRYVFILRDLDSNVQRLDEDNYIPKYTGCKIIYDDKSFCIFRADHAGVPAGTTKIYIYEFYAPNCGQELLSYLKRLFKTINLDIELEIIDHNTRAKKFWLKNLGKPYNVTKEEYWITGYKFFLENK